MLEEGRCEGSSGLHEFLHRLVSVQRKLRQSLMLTISSASFTAINVETAGAISTSSGFASVSETTFCHSVTNFPLCVSFNRVPMR